MRAMTAPTGKKTRSPAPARNTSMRRFIGLHAVIKRPAGGFVLELGHGPQQELGEIPLVPSAGLEQLREEQFSVVSEHAGHQAELSRLLRRHEVAADVGGR